MFSEQETDEIVGRLREVAKRIKPGKKYTGIELLAAFSRGLDTITDPVLMRRPTDAASAQAR